jgi:hypothetical protein
MTGISTPAIRVALYFQRGKKISNSQPGNTKVPAIEKIDSAID